MSLRDLGPQEVNDIVMGARGAYKEKQAIPKENKGNWHGINGCMVFWPWFKDHLLKNESNLIENGLELMAKTIRSHPTSHILVLEPIFWTILIFSKFGPKMDLCFSFSDLPTSEKTTPQRKQNAHGPSLHIRFLSKCNFWYCIYHHLSTCWGKLTFLI